MMIRFAISFALFFLSAWISSWFLPWWFPVVLGLAIGFWKPKHGALSFLCGASALSLLWLIQISVINSANEGLLLARLSELFKPLPLYWLTLIVAFLLGGFSMLSGKYARDAFFEEDGGGKRRRRR